MAPQNQPHTVFDSNNNPSSSSTTPKNNPLPQSLLNPCAQFSRKVRRVTSFGNYHLVACPQPINVPFARQLLRTRKPHLLSVRQLPPSFWQSRGRSSQIEAEIADLLDKDQEEQHRFAEMPSSCKDIRAALAQCLQESDCIMIQRNTPADCLRPPLLETMPTKCQQLKTGYGQCKRGMVDMRKRFRGNQSIGMSKDLDGVSTDAKVGEQLYAGKPAYGSGVKATSGNEPVEKDWRELENEKYGKD